MAKKNSLAIELVERGIKIAISRESGRAKKLIDFEFFPDSSQDLREKIATFLKSKKLHHPVVIASLSRYIVSCRYVTLPSSNYKELEEMMPFQIRRLFPYTAEEVVFSFEIIDTDDKGFSRVVLFVAQKERVENFLNVLADLKMKPRILTISSWGILNWYLSQKKEIKEEALGVVNVAANYLEFSVIFKKDRLVFGRVVLLSAESDISAEIKQCFNIYNKDSNIAEISRLILVGDRDPLKDVSAGLSASLGITVEILDPWQELPISLSDNLVKKSRNISWVSVVGLLAQAKTSYINLLPAQARNELQQKRKAKSRNKTIMFFAGFLILASLNIAQYIYSRSEMLREIDKKLIVLNPEIDKLSNMQRTLQFVNTQFSKKFLSITILKELYTITPAGVNFNIFIYEKDNQLVIKGMAQQMSSVFNYVNILEKSEFLENAQVRFATKRTIQGREFTDFEIACALKSN